MRRTVALACLLAACREASSPAPASDTSAPRRAGRFPGQAVLEAELAASPEEGTEEGLPAAEHGRIRDNSPRANRIAPRPGRIRCSRWRSRSIPRRSPDTPQWVTYGVLRDNLERERALRVCRNQLWGVASYVNGWQAIYTDLALIQPVGTDTLRAQALARARALPRFIDTEIANLRQGLDSGFSSPKVIVRNVIRQLDGILRDAGAANRRSIRRPSAIRRPEFGAELARVISDGAQSGHPALPRLPGRVNTCAARARGPRRLEQSRWRRLLPRRGPLLRHRRDGPRFGLRDGPGADGAHRRRRCTSIADRSFGGEALHDPAAQRCATDPRYTYRTSQEIIDTAQAVIIRAKAAMGKWFGRLAEGGRRHPAVPRVPPEGRARRASTSRRPTMAPGRRSS